ncbi:MAG: hypothetical protein ACYSWS_00820, partial [Planctomycetota bacterium]
DLGGKIYQITSADSVSLLQTTTGALGEGFLVHDNYLYYALTKDIGRYGPLDGTPAFVDAFTSWWLAEYLQTTGGGTTATDYTTPTTIAETATARQTFVADHDPVVSIVIDVDVVGTGNWTVTLHDSNNRSLGTSTIANGSMSVGDNTFTLSAIARVIPGESYHFHVTSTVADGGVDTDTASDLEGAEYTINYQALITATFHPMSEMLGGWAIGNERYIGYFDNINGEYNPTQIMLAPGFEVRSLYKNEEFLVAEAWKGQSLEEAEAARRYFWDGTSPTYNYFEDLTMGGPNAAFSYRNSIVGVYGNRGAIYAGSKPLTKVIGEAPKLVRGKKVEVYPGAIAEYEERLVIGYSGVTDDSTGLEQGVYEFGSQSSALSNTLNFPYIISTGTTQGTTLKIGAVGVFGTDLYIGWRDDTTYGIDKVALGDGAIAAASWESRIFDASDPDKTKQAIKLEITFKALTTGQSVTPKYKINRAASFTSGTAASTVGDTKVDLYINSNFKEIEFGFDLASTSNTFIVITGINFIYDNLVDEGETE